MNVERLVIVNADDFGQSPGVNAGVVRAHEQGVVTSATLMVRWPAAEDAAGYARANARLSVGLHLDLGEWEYRDGNWIARYEVVDTADPVSVEDEVSRQLGAFEQLVRRPPSHLDSHQHVHRDDPTRSALRRAGKRLGVPVRHFNEKVRYRGEFYGQDARGFPMPEAITVDALIALLGDLPSGATEIGCHPGQPDDLETTYSRERATELETLCDDRVRSACTELGIRLGSFADLVSYGG